jgi:hypothetical protein
MTKTQDAVLAPPHEAPVAKNGTRATGCCPPLRQTTCCAPSEKAACCGEAHSEGCACRAA